MADDKINLDDIQPKGLEAIPTKPIEIPQELKEIKTMEKSEVNKFGVDNLIKSIDFVGSVCQAVAKAKADDGKITMMEYAGFLPIAMKVPSLIGSLSLIPMEATDLITDEEKEQIANSIKSLNLCKEDTDCLIADAVKLVIDIKNFIFKYFVK